MNDHEPWVMAMSDAPGIPAPRETVDHRISDGSLAIAARVGRVEPVDPRTFTTMLESLQVAYVAGVVASAGCTLETIDKDVWGFDGWITRPPPQIGNGEEVTVAVQLKNTTQVKPDPTKPYFSYRFKERRHFDALARRRERIKAFCIVMATPPQQLDWITVDHEALQMRHCCYWANLEGYQIEAGVASPTVRVPTANIFDTNSLMGIMDRIDRGEAVG